MEIKFKQSPNFTKNEGTPKVGFVIHGTLGSFDGAVEWLCTPPEKRNPVSYSSAHYVVARDGRITQLVKNEDMSWHAGVVSQPSAYAQKMLPKNTAGAFINPNQSFIGIEFAWGYDVDGDGDVDAMDGTLTCTPEQIASGLQIIKESGIKNPILIGHKDICSYKKDDMEFLCKILRDELAKPVVPVPPSKDAIKAQITNLMNQVKDLIAKL